MTDIKCFASANKYYLSKEQIVALAIIYPPYKVRRPEYYSYVSKIEKNRERLIREIKCFSLYC